MLNTPPSIPQSLHPGSRIGIAAPAGTFNPDAFADGINILENQGFQLVVPPRLTARNGYLAGSDRHRAEVIQSLFADPAIDAILCARGGYGAMRILPLLDYAAIRRTPKVFMGFSDITALLTTLYLRCGFITYHGPVITSLGKASISTRTAMNRAITGDQPLVFRPKNGFVLKSGVATGPVIGGNLTILTHLLGTPFAPRYDGHILFLEDCNEKPYRIDRMLTQLRLSGSLDGIEGLFLGQFKSCGPLDTVKAIVDDIFQDQGIPIMGGFDIGHKRTNLTLPIGLPARLDTQMGQLAYLALGVSQD